MHLPRSIISPALLGSTKAYIPSLFRFFHTLSSQYHIISGASYSRQAKESLGTEEAVAVVPPRDLPGASFYISEDIRWGAKRGV